MIQNNFKTAEPASQDTPAKTKQDLSLMGKLRQWIPRFLIWNSVEEADRPTYPWEVGQLLRSTNRKLHGYSPMWSILSEWPLSYCRWSSGIRVEMTQFLVALTSRIKSLLDSQTNRNGERMNRRDKHLWFEIYKIMIIRKRVSILCICIWVCAFVFMCAHVCMFTCVHVYECVRVLVSMPCVCVWVCTFVFICACSHMCMQVHTCVDVEARGQPWVQFFNNHLFFF